VLKRTPPARGASVGRRAPVRQSQVGEEREVRAARNQALFRVVNEKLKDINSVFEHVVGSNAIACECADLQCIETVEIAREEYDEVRANPRHFVVAPGHIYPDVERVVREGKGYTVVEKTGCAGEVAEAAERSG
jgi:hypothetical protein